MNASQPAHGPFQWKVLAVSDDKLESTLNGLDPHWEVFSIVPTIKFSSSMMMGAPLPSAVLCNVVLRRSREE